MKLPEMRPHKVLHHHDIVNALTAAAIDLSNGPDTAIFVAINAATYRGPRHETCFANALRRRRAPRPCLLRHLGHAGRGPLAPLRCRQHFRTRHRMGPFSLHKIVPIVVQSKALDRTASDLYKEAKKPWLQ